MDEQMSRTTLIEAVLVEMDRVWGPEGFGGSFADYDWLLAHYGISEEEDVNWQFVLQHATDDLPDEDAEDAEVMLFLDDDAAVGQFLRELLQKYRNGTAVHGK
jgi:hypothetical protein